MITLERDRLVFRFPEVHRDALLRVEFQRTLRIPDDDRTYSLPPGLGNFPLRHVDDHASRVPEAWLERGGVMLPMYQSEALWINFRPPYLPRRQTAYPMAVKIAAGKINAVTGDPWDDVLHREPQDYAIVPEQPWLDGYCVEKGIIRQFVAMPLGSGYSAEEQITGVAEHGGIQIVVYPMKGEVFEEMFPEVDEVSRGVYHLDADVSMTLGAAPPGPDMGLAPGGRMRQEIYHDPFSFGDWSTDVSSRCFVHIANSLVWSSITGAQPPTTPPTAAEYSRAGLPWFDYYDESATPLEGSSTLSALKSVAASGREKGDVPLPENETVRGERVVRLRRGLAAGQVREGEF